MATILEALSPTPYSFQSQTCHFVMHCHEATPLQEADGKWKRLGRKRGELEGPLHSIQPDDKRVEGSDAVSL